MIRQLKNIRTRRNKVLETSCPKAIVIKEFLNRIQSSLSEYDLISLVKQTPFKYPKGNVLDKKVEYVRPINMCICK